MRPHCNRPFARPLPGVERQQFAHLTRSLGRAGQRRGAKSQVRHGDGDDWMNFENVELGLAITWNFIHFAFGGET